MTSPQAQEADSSSRSVPGSAFGVGAGRKLTDLELADIRHLVVEAARIAKRLGEDFDRWQRSADLDTEVRIDETDPRVEEIYLVSRKPLPYRTMATLAAQTLHSGRTALDHLNGVMMRKFASEEYDETKIYFPITENGRDWRSWRNRHRGLPEWAQDRYRELQPSTGPFKGLKGLQELDNLGKHRQLIPIRVAVVGELGTGRATFASPVDEEQEQAVSLDAVSNELTHDVRRILVSRITYAAPIESIEQAERARPEIDPLFYFGSEHYTLREISDLPRRIESAIDFVATGERSHLAAYQAPFVDPLIES